MVVLNTNLNKVEIDGKKTKIRVSNDKREPIK